MTTSILGAATRKIEDIQAWLRSTDIVASERQGAQEIASLLPLWKAAGEEFGVRWDISVGQLIEESGWFGFKNDVRKAQCNPTGIGATGGGVVGDSFPDWQIGFRAHFQNMALRARRVPAILIEQVIAPYVKKNYSTISTRVTAAGKPTTDWEDLTGTYAMNPSYHNNIFALVAKMDKWIAQNKTEPEPADVTWHNAHILIDEKTRQMEIGLASYAGDQLRSLGRFSVDSSLLSAYLSKFPNAHNIVKAEPTKAWPGIIDPDKPKPTGKRGLLDPGHSFSRPGARSNNKLVKEEMLNKLQAQIIKEILEAAGNVADIYDPDPDNLTDVGNHAKGYDFFVSLHHNSYDGSGTPAGGPYPCVMCLPGDRAKKSSVILAGKISAALSETLGIPNFGGTNGEKGVYRAGLSVLNAAEPVCAGPCVLVESYFLNGIASVEVAVEKSTKAAKAIAKVLAESV
jgi:N-acetylmuramoyl-L-alanine amidase